LYQDTDDQACRDEEEGRSADYSLVNISSGELFVDKGQFPRDIFHTQPVIHLLITFFV